MRRFSHKIKSKPNKGGIWEYNGVIKKFQGCKQSGESKNPLRANEGIFGYFLLSLLLSVQELWAALFWTQMSVDLEMPVISVICLYE